MTLIIMDFQENALERSWVTYVGRSKRLIRRTVNVLDKLTSFLRLEY
jgi:hypothetical protein